MPDAAAWVTLVVLGAITYGIRASFMARADKMTDLSPTVRQALRMVPAATLAALTLPALLRPDGAWAPLSPEALAGVIAGIVAWKTKSALVTVVVGLVALVAITAAVG